MGTKHSARAAVYVRISRDAKETGLGVARQRRDCEALADKLGWTVADVYEDNDVSASKGKPRPAYEGMMRAIEAGRIDAVIVWDVDRLTRTPRELEDVIDYADRQGLQLASVGGEIDLGTEQGRMLARMKGTVARYEVEQSSRRLKRKHRELAESGRPNGPRAFGWDRLTEPDAHGYWEHVNDAEATILRDVARRLLEGETLWSIVQDLNARGVATSTGGRWFSQTLRRTMLRARNAGDRSYKGKVIGPGAWEPILDHDTHDRVVALLTDPARRSNNRGTARRYLLTGYALCGVCGRPVIGRSEHVYSYRTYRAQYACPHEGCRKVSRDMRMADEVVEGVVVAVLERFGVSAMSGDPGAVVAADERIEALEAKLALAADQFADDQITGDQLQRVTARLRPRLDKERARRRAALPSADLMPSGGESVRESWALLNLDRKRQVMQALGMRVTILPVGAGNARSAGPESVIVESNQKH